MPQKQRHLFGHHPAGIPRRNLKSDPKCIPSIGPNRSPSVGPKRRVTLTLAVALMPGSHYHSFLSLALSLALSLVLPR